MIVLSLPNLIYSDEYEEKYTGTLCTMFVIPI